MSDYKTIIDFGSNNLILGVFDKENNNVYCSKEKNFGNFEVSLNNLIRDAEKNLSTHIDDVIVLYDNPNFYSLDMSIKKVFDHAISIKEVYENLIEESLYIVSQNNFKDQVIHLIVNNIEINEGKKLEKIYNDIKIKSIKLQIKFICLNKILVDNVNNHFKKNNIKILNLYCSSYVKTIYLKKKDNNKDHNVFIDIGYERTSSYIFNNGGFDFFKSITIGGNNITKDISNVLKLDLEYSENLKINLNKSDKNLFFNKTENKQTNPYSEILKKNISVDLLKQIIEARINEIFELVLLKSDYIKKFNTLSKPKLIVIGGGSKLDLNIYSLTINKYVSELILYEESNLHICEAGLDYNSSEESFFIKTKKKPTKQGFFEKFFNLFSK